MTFKKTLKVLSSSLNVILFISLIAMTFIVISAKASGGEPEVFGHQIKTVLSGSMEPMIQTGSIIAIKPLEEEQKSTLSKGDVVTFLNKDESLITHRVVDVTKTGESVSYVTKGDNNNAADTEPVLAQNVVGQYADFTIPYAGYLMSYATSKAGSLALMIIPGLLLLIYAGYQIWGGIKQFEKELVKKNSAT
ncbi:signal peptidase I [Halobacillus locisalis]|uniref:Signal peptidase I n=1 Tax=Halobacillus locisalis TaxID=220753 RepID=A0A838CT14_9BACI|nr:signal peptidase I [Halobacillus locisalis]MBA2174905.1 signal peptidase I [Halobacillus locisalis]